MVSGWELGRHTTSIAHRKTLCSIYGEPPEVLFAHQDEALSAHAAPLLLASFPEREAMLLCRACLEETLKAAMPVPTLNAPQLDLLIDDARQKHVLDDCLTEVAHSIRKKANKFLHGHAITEEDSRETLDNIRSVVEQVFSSDSAA